MSLSIHLSMNVQSLWNLKKIRFGIMGKSLTKKAQTKNKTELDSVWAPEKNSLENVPQCNITREQLES